MKQRILCLFIFTTILVSVSGLNTYNAELIGQIQVGKEDGKMEWLGIEVGPLAMTINDSKLYISDTHNSRINIYDLNLNYLSKIEMQNVRYETNIFLASKLKIDNDGNIIGAGYGFGLIKINNKGEILYAFPTNQISDRVWSSGIFFPYQDKILFYDGIGKNEKIKFIDKNGAIKDGSTLADQIDADNAASMKRVFQTVAAGNDENTKKLRKFLNDKKRVLYNERLLTGRLNDLRDYYSLLKTLSKDKVTDKVINRSTETIDPNEYSFIDFDSDGNSYWIKSSSIGFILVISKYGEVLNNFTTDKRISSIAIAPNGDIYFFRGRPELDANVFRIYKISCRW